MMKPVMVIGATNRPDALDSALRRAGRFDREILMGVPDQAARLSILGVLTSRLRLAGDFNLEDLARRTPGYVGADLSALAKEAAAIAVNRIFKTFLTSTPVATAADSGAEGAASGAEGAAGAVVKAEGEPRDGAAGMSAGMQRFRSAGTAAAAAEPGDGGMASERGEGCDVGEGNKGGSGNRGGQGGGGRGNSSGEGGEAQKKSVTDLRGGLRREALTVEELQPLALTMSDFEEAVERVQPSAKREGFATVPDVKWEDVGSLGDVRDELNLSICEPILNPEKFKALGLSAPTGVLLYGPPGCGKTLVAKAVARESGANFISVKGPELLNKFVGESERAVRTLFLRAEASSPCVIFFDELDALCPKRGGEGGVSSERVVNQLLTEMDGLNSRKSVFIIAATNRPDMIDPAMLRPGRLDKLLYVRLPQQAERQAILATLARKMPLAPDIDLAAAAADPRTEGFSGADLASLMREAAMCALKESLAKDRANLGQAPGDQSGKLLVRKQHLEAALRVILPSVSAKDEKRYEVMASRLRQSRAKVTESDVESSSTHFQAP